MNGRAAHDAVLSLLTDGPRRLEVLAGGALPPALGGATFDRERLRRMARFLGRHFYRERIVRLCRPVRSLRAFTGVDPVAVVDAPDFGTFVDGVVLGSAAAADEIAGRIERMLSGVATDRIPYFADLVRYSALRIRVEGGMGQGRLDSDWDLPPLLRALDTEPREVPVAARSPIALLVFREAGGRVSTALVGA
jgi:hypothetical protein